MSNDSSPYIGRFAPSPTGPLHFGSLVAAVASYLQARARHGKWLVRMEDVDELRNIKGSSDDILRTLEAYGFQWDGEVIFQTQRKEAYAETLQKLINNNLVYRCTCSRRDLRAIAQQGKCGLIYPGTCINKNHSENTEHSLRILTKDQQIEFKDAVMGSYGHNPKHDVGDFIIKRRDGLFAYQLAVVVDDAWQNITDIVRGFDLLDSTPRQIYLQQRLNYPQPSYAHLPIAINSKGDKLSKQTGAKGIKKVFDADALTQTLIFLGQQPPENLSRESLQNFWQWALENWDISKVPHKTEIHVQYP
jgi:glutamyl-Q tRNA(Asp) synthetase